MHLSILFMLMTTAEIKINKSLSIPRPLTSHETLTRCDVMHNLKSSGRLGKSLLEDVVRKFSSN